MLPLLRDKAMSMWTTPIYYDSFVSMFRKALSFLGKHPVKIFLAVSLAALVYGLAAASDFGSAVGWGDRVDGVTRPHTGSIKVPSKELADSTTELSSSGEKTEANEASSCDHLLLKVGSDHVLSEDFVPPNLVYLSSYGISTRGAEDMLRTEVVEQLGLLLSDAAADGVEVLVASGYRSYWEQAGTYEWFKDAYGEEAGKLSVPPGESEHQLGTAVDFTSSQANYELVSAFDETAAGIWLKENSAKYGFVLSYTEAREEETGVRYEPWHYRFISVEKALEVEDSGKGATPSIYREGPPRCYQP